MLAGFVGSFNEVAQFFLVGRLPTGGEPTKKKAERIAQIVEPVAKDVGAQINIFASDHAQVAFHVGYLDANTVQNGAQRLMAPGLPAEMIERGVLLVLEQLRNNRAAKTGDRGYIQKLSEKAVKLRFMTPEAKMAIIDMPDNPLKCSFLVDVKVHSVSGDPKLYEIISVLETISGD